jgi:hypothetical protein
MSNPKYEFTLDDDTGFGCSNNTLKIDAGGNTYIDNTISTTGTVIGGGLGGTCGYCRGTPCTCTTGLIGGPCNICWSTPCACASSIWLSPCSSCGLNPCGCQTTFQIRPSTSGTSTFSITNDNKYSVFRLPEPDIIPNKVYISGRLLTVGILGSDVQAAFNGKDKLVFAPGEIAFRFNEKLTISLDYGDWLHHYNVELNGSNVAYEEDSNIIKAKLVSKVAQR